MKFKVKKEYLETLLLKGHIFSSDDKKLFLDGLPDEIELDGKQIEDCYCYCHQAKQGEVYSCSGCIHCRGFEQV